MAAGPALVACSLDALSPTRPPRLVVLQAGEVRGEDLRDLLHGGFSGGGRVVRRLLLAASAGNSARPEQPLGLTRA